jgi:hypothetical protein
MTIPWWVFRDTGTPWGYDVPISWDKKGVPSYTYVFTTGVISGVRGVQYLLPYNYTEKAESDYFDVAQFYHLNSTLGFSSRYYYPEIVSYNASYASNYYKTPLLNNTPLYTGLAGNQTEALFVKGVTVRGMDNMDAPGHFINEVFGIEASVRYQNNKNLVYGNKFNDTTSAEYVEEHASQKKSRFVIKPMNRP